MALNQVVLPGFAAYRIGTETKPKSMQADTPEEDAEEALDADDVDDEAP
jgi:uncharacterized protein